MNYELVSYQLIITKEIKTMSKNKNRQGYWAVVLLFIVVFASIYAAGLWQESKITSNYLCHTDQECYNECVQYTGNYEECE